MRTLGEFGKAIEQIREATESVEVRGRANRAYMDLIYEKCNEMIRALNAIAAEAEETAAPEEETDNAPKGETTDAKPDQSPAGQD